MSTTMEKLVSEQEGYIKEFKKVISNYTKDSADRKTSKSYFAERLRRLIGAWSFVEQIHNKILQIADRNENHAYFTNKIYDTAKALYMQYDQEFNEIIQGFTDDESQQQTSAHGTNTSSKVTSNVIQNTNFQARRQSMMDALRRTIHSISAVQNAVQARSFYQVKLETVKSQWNQLVEVNYKILEDGEHSQQQEFILLEEEVQQVMIHLSSKLEVNTEVPTASHRQANLPTITPPIFDGNYLQWRQFADLFTQMIHNQQMSNCQKMWYLKTNLTKEAEKLVTHLPLSEANYETAWTLLKERYENPRILVSSYLTKLLSQPSHSTESTSAAGLKNMHDITQECLHGLQNVGVDTKSWDPLLLHILLRKMDKATHESYEQSLSNPRKLQPLREFLDFISKRFQALESLNGKSTHPRDRMSFKSLPATEGNKRRCSLCNEEHPMFKCSTFLSQNVAERITTVNRLKLCMNCLKSGHVAKKCQSRSCFKCSKKHNTLLHLNDYKTTAQTTASSTQVAMPKEKGTSQHVLLGTALVRASGSNGVQQDLRVLLDSGSQINIITQRAVNRLKLKTQRDCVQIEGIGMSKQKGTRRVSLTVSAKRINFEFPLEAVVLNELISLQPRTFIDISKWGIPKNVVLADPQFNHPGSIDLLIGAEFFHRLLSVGQIKLSNQLPRLQNTVFGWIVAGGIKDGTIKSTSCNTISCNVGISSTNIDDQIEKFWKIEEITPTTTHLSPAEKRCEHHFTQTRQRLTSGRFMVRLPFEAHSSELGESRAMAYRRFLAIERRLDKQPLLKSQYGNFMNEYLRLHHMKEVDEESILTPNFYLPHHCVARPESSTTKLRVVFDGSATTSSGKSLNALLYTGPTVQDDLFTILLRFRLPRYVFTADIEKMYRQILVHPDDTNFQLILWRQNSKDILKCYKLQTVTYGTRSAPYLATRCLKELAEMEQGNYPEGAAVLKNDFYVDDVMSGANTIHEANCARNQLTELLRSAGFKLRKWCANHQQLMNNVAEEDKALKMEISASKEESIKTLGLTWLPESDQFKINMNWEENQRISKRIVTSQIARLFDPLGIMAPVVITAKLFLQQLWMLKLDWDAALPMELHTKWTTFYKELQKLQTITFPRHVFDRSVPKTFQLHTFCDASERAYGAAVYIRAVLPQRKIIVRLLCAKSKVAPLKRTTLPRLELCAANLAAELTNRVINDLKVVDIKTTFWTDSEIVLAWINSASSSFHTFVANRISSIQSVSLPEQWRHINSKLNPADLVSRGISPEAMKTQHLWLYGPLFLHGDESLWPPAYDRRMQVDVDVERKVNCTVTTRYLREDGTPTENSHQLISVAQAVDEHHQPNPDIWENINHRNSFKTLQRICAYVIKFATNARKQAKSEKHLTPGELDNATKLIVRQMQKAVFKNEIKEIQGRRGLPKSNSLCSLAPFLDTDGLLRVGGRLENSSLSYEAKHPMLLPHRHHWTNLIMTNLHEVNMHCGPQALLSITRQRFWPVQGKSIARSIVNQCVRCTKSNPKLFNQQMGSLPAPRSQPARPFVNSGVDFCGPIHIHYKSRGKRPQKAYIAVFCCFATKAVHLEVVSNLTTEAFLCAVRRFTGRRGRCKALYCDNATNFVGANNQLNELSDSIHSRKAQEKISNTALDQGIEFHFIPPRAPHFGGLWEAAVKSAKTLLRKGLASAELTYEEFETVIVDIEAILNSRPLTALSDNANDLAALTPGHFLVGEPLTAIVDPSAVSGNPNLLKRWSILSRIKEEFWQRWSKEYLHELQCRSKWKQRCPNIGPGMLVLIKEDNIPIMKWPLGKVEKTYEGADGLIRVVDVKMESGIFKRPIHRLAPLPIGPNHDTDATVEKGELSTSSARKPTSQAEPVAKRRRGLNPIASLMSVLMVCLLAPANSSMSRNPILVESFPAQLGIHFENRGAMRLINAEWKLIVYYDLKQYWREMNMFESVTVGLRRSCNQANKGFSCQAITQHFEQILQELMMDNELLQEHSSRSRRGAIDVIGNTANLLFGVLDSKYAEEMSKTIQNIRGNEGELQNLLAKQTSILDSTHNVMKQHQQWTAESLKLLNHQMGSVTLAVNNITTEQEFERFQQNFIVTALQLMLIANRIQRIQTALTDVIMDCKHGKISPLLLTPQQLKEQVREIKTHLSEDLDLIVNSQQITELYRYMEVEGGIAKDQIIFRVKMPLANHARFELFRLWPIPLPTKGSLVEFDISSQFLAISLHRDQHYALLSQEMALCQRSNQGDYLCKQHHPVYYKNSRKNICEIEIFSSKEANGCTVKPVQGEAAWNQLHDSNQWIFAVKHVTPIHAVCHNETFSMSINGSGLLSLEPDCVIKGDSIQIRGQQLYSNTLRSSYTRFGGPFEGFTMEHAPHLQYNTSQEQPTTEDINEQLSQIKTLMDRPHATGGPANIIHYPTLGYVTIFLIVCAATTVFWKIYKSMRNDPPAPRNIVRDV